MISIKIYKLLIYLEHPVHSILIKEFKIPSSPKCLVLAYIFPIAIGWITWVELLGDKSINPLNFLMNLFKALALASFLRYIKRILGWVCKMIKTSIQKKTFSKPCSPQPIKGLLPVLNLASWIILKSLKSSLKS